MSIFFSQPKTLQEYNLKLMQWCIQKLKIETQIQFTDEMPNALEHIQKQEVLQYDQVFMEKHGFIADLSILDWIFNVGA